MKKTAGLLFTLLLAGCGAANKQKTEKLNLSEQTTGKTSVVLVGATLTQEFKNEILQSGIKLEGQNIIRLTGRASDLNQLNIPVENTLDYILDSEIEVSRDQTGKPDAHALYLAKKEFGILDLWKTNPEADGRGVIVGVIDDGISPHQIGFQRTSTGLRKFLAKTSQSSFTTSPLIDSTEGFTAEIKEGNTFGGKLDLNLDGAIKNIKATVSLDGAKVCLDLNTDDNFSADECRGTFAKTGEYFILPKQPTLVIMAEVDLDKKTLKVLQPEKDDDSHGEGVASVMAAHNQGNLGAGFEGVAPGAQIVDYDLSELTDKAVENEYTLGTFLLAIDWLGSQGAEVANVSYSLFFTNAQTQTFMAKALATIIEKHNIVISFSAGNNGPGLGSLNRRAMYPSSVLVAGAHVPKELDERVWGVTGLPEDGRVVYYSSRGPGAGGTGPTLIAPLASLTHSSPNLGYRAFNGTSSASPALAGAATVLVSAIKQAGLKMHAATVVHALRLSGRQIKNEPFVSQGYGLPQIGRALEIYRELISGTKFLNVIHTISRGGLDGAAAQGIFVKTSEAVDSVASYRVNLTGEISTLAPSEATINLLTPVAIEYSKGISGARELWVSVSQSRLSIDVNPEEMLGESSEAFGEIRVISKVDKSIMAIIPVTAIRDVRPKTFFRQNLTVSAEEGARLHLNIPETVKGIRVKARLIEGESSFLNFGTYNPDYIRMEQIGFTREFVVPTAKAGHYQITVSMNGGTPKSATVEFEVEELALKLNTEVAASEGKISISNLAQTGAQGELTFIRDSAPLKSQLFNSKNIPEITLKVGKGTYGADLLPVARYDLNYLYPSCSIMVQNDKGEFEATVQNPYKHEGETEVTLKFRCVPFDLNIAGTDSLFWKLQVSQLEEEAKILFDLNGKFRRDYTLPKLQPGTYTVEFSTFFEKKRISIGKLEII